MVSLHSIFKDIAALIGDDTDKDLLISKIKNNQFDWERIVQVASKHLVIPLIYYKLKSKELLHLLDDELHFYLEEIANQNFSRNEKILEEVNEITSLLNKHEIDHVFVKGAAHLVSGLYENIGERMIGDIDILVNEEQLSTTQNLLFNNGFISPFKVNFGAKFFESKHLPRLIPEKGLAAVEVHRKLLHKQVDNQLIPQIILKNKRLIDNISVPNQTDLLNHTILNFEINDYGYFYNYLGIRNVYDALAISANLSEEDIYSINQTKYHVSFVSKLLSYFPGSRLNQVGNTRALLKQLFLMKQKNKYVRNIFFKIWPIWQFGGILLHRFFLFINNSAYRKAVVSDRKRIQDLISNKIRSLG